MRSCPICGASMDGRRPQTRYCSTRCRSLASRARRHPEQIAAALLAARAAPARCCAVCGVSLAGRRWGARYCSATCRARGHRQTVQKRAQSVHAARPGE